MSSSKLDLSPGFQLVDSRTASPTRTILDLSWDRIQVRSNGIEFHSQRALTVWTEMTLQIESSKRGTPVSCRGIVVGCQARAGGGFTVSMMLFDLSAEAHGRIASLAQGPRSEA